ncbi:MAG: hypothetical protein R3F36_01445 [Candidatus Competibacteraceae bacterium]
MLESRATRINFVILSSGGERVARIEPASAPTAPTGAELDRLLADAIPHLAYEAIAADADSLACQARRLNDVD